jgi:hypothetical protein
MLASTTLERGAGVSHPGTMVPAAAVQAEPCPTVQHHHQVVSAIRPSHALVRIQRSERLARGIRGFVHKPVLLDMDTVVHAQPGYLESRSMVRNLKHHGFPDPVFTPALRCFYTGTPCSIGPQTGPGRDPLLEPWHPTRDHLVPVRRDVPGKTHCASVLGGSTVLCSYIANTTLGLAPMAVKLKIRHWLSTARFDPSDTSVAAGANLRWLIISMLDDFRWRGRYPWSLDAGRRWWDRDFSQSFMDNMWKLEHAFLAMDERARNRYVGEFEWRF